MYHVILAAPGVYPFAPYGGMEKYYYNLGKHLASLGVKIEFVTSGPETCSVTYNNIKYNFVVNTKTIYNSIFSIGVNIFRHRVFEFLSRKEKFDLLHTTYAAFPYVLKSERKLVITQCVGLSYLALHNFYKRAFVYANMYLPDKLSYKFSDAIAFEGPNQIREFSKLLKLDLSNKKVYIIPNGVDLKYVSKYRRLSVCRKAYGFSEDDFLIITISRLVANKGIDVAIKALKIIVNSGINAKLILIGTGPKTDELKKLALKLGVNNRIQHYENVSEITKYELLSISDVFVMPSLYEGMPTVILEAMAMAKPIIATKIDDVEKLVIEGVNGYLVKPGDPKAIAEKITYIYDKNMANIMGLNSLKIVSEFDWRKIASKVLEYYNDLLGK